MNPFDLTGPEFLLFYVLFGAAVLGALVYLRRQSEGQTEHSSQLDPSDPYQIAYLRGGPNEALRVATVSLIDRGLLQVKPARQTTQEDEIRVGRLRAADFARRHIERALVEHFAKDHDPKSIFRAPGPQDAARSAYEARLRDLRLIPDEAMLAQTRVRAVGASVILAGVSVAKIAIALDRGRTNVLFLIGLTALFVFLAFYVSRSRRTPLGDAALADLRTLFRDLRDRANAIRPGGDTNELALLAGTFGLAALTRPEYAYAHTLYPRSAGASGSRWRDGSAGSSCGSIGGGDGGGSSCGGGGGGGCGGGCGGCGGG